MADTSVETVSSGVITITFTDNGADYDSTTNFPGGLKVKAIKFWPSAANDVLMIRNKLVTGPTIVEMKDVLGAGVSDSSFGEGVWMFPYLKIADCTFGTPANVKVMFVIA